MNSSAYFSIVVVRQSLLKKKEEREGKKGKKVPRLLKENSNYEKWKKRRENAFPRFRNYSSTISRHL